MEDDIDGILLGRGELLGLCSRREIDPDPGAADIDYCQPDEECDRGHDLEVDERLYSHASHLLQIRVAGNPDDERREEKRSNDRFDHPEEDQAQDAQVHRNTRPIVTNLRPNDHAHQNPGSK